MLATLRTTLEPTTALLREKSAAAGVATQIEESLCDGAFQRRVGRRHRDP